MKVLLFSIAVIVVILSVEAGYGDILDEYDWIGVAQDKEKFLRVIECLQEEEPCDNLQKLKEHGIKVFQTNCSDCTETQKEKFEEYKNYIAETYPDEYAIILTLVEESAST